MNLPSKRSRIPLANGTVLDERFEIMELLGAGCFGAVYRAQQLVFGHPLREIAIKLFDTDVVTTQNMHDLFNDAIAVISLQEDNPKPEVARHIIQVYDIGVLRNPPPSRAFVTMKLVRGGKTLQSQVRRFKDDGMPVATSLHFLRQILVPVAWMHTLDAPVVHGDLKPDNVLLTETGDLIVTDFGLAGRLPLGSLGGAIQYQAPETLGRPSALPPTAETRADVYGIGLIWYELLTGRHPFDKVGLEALGADDSRGFVLAHLEARRWPIRGPMSDDDPSQPKRIPPASEINEELREHPQLEAMLARCLAYSQLERHPNARVLLNDVDQYMREGRIAGCSAAPLPPEPAPVAAQLPVQMPEALIANSRTFTQQGKHAEAIATAEKASKVTAGAVPAQLALVRALSGDRQFDRAKEIWQKTADQAPENPEVYEAGAELYRAIGKPGMAQRLAEQAATLRAKGGRKF